MKKIYVLVLTAIIAFSCSKDDDTTPEIENQEVKEEEEEVIAENDSLVYFTLKTNAYYVENFIESSYLILNDVDGNILEHTVIENDKVYEFKAKKEEAPEIFTVSRYIKINQSYFKYNSLNSYYNIEKGTVWNFNGSKLDDNEEVVVIERKSFNLVVENVSEDVINYTLSTPSDYFSRTHYGYRYDANIEFNNVELEKQDSKFLLTLHFKDGKSKYMIIDNIIEDEERIVNADNLNEFDSYIPINLPKSSENYHKSLDFDYNDKVYTTTKYGVNIINNVQPTFGVLNDFENFRVSISSRGENFLYNYSQNTKELNDITINQFNTDFEIISNYEKQFEFTTNVNHNHKHSSWSYNIENGFDYENFNWYFHSDSRSYFVTPKIPQEFLDLYSNFDFSKLEYDSTVLEKSERAYNPFGEYQETAEEFPQFVKERITFYSLEAKNKSSKNQKFQEKIKQIEKRLRQ